MHCQSSPHKGHAFPQCGNRCLSSTPVQGVISFDAAGRPMASGQKIRLMSGDTEVEKHTPVDQQVFRFLCHTVQ